jgi:phosphatidylglycerol lysyltransferase
LLTWAFLTARFLFQSGRVRTLYPDPKQITKLRQLLERVSGHFLTHLLFIGDKPFFWSKDNEAVLAYRRVGKLLIVLGDPIGQESSVRCIIREFRTFADLHGHIPVFYQIKAEMLPFYHENGYRFFMLGEEGVLKLDTFSLTGSHKKDLRAVHNRFEREGYRFEVESPPFTPVRIRELKEVSDVWLEGRKEKTFSIGTFQESYLHLAPIGQLRNREGELLAFASLMPSYDRGDSVSVDLTRHLPDVPNGVMDALFLHLFEWAKENGYKRFNLGMAPLSSVGESLYAHLSERVAHWLFRKGTSLYAFQGVRRFKSKFEPYWEPRYLAYPKRTFLPWVILGITRLISGKIKS